MCGPWLHGPEPYLLPSNEADPNIYPPRLTTPNRPPFVLVTSSSTVLFVTLVARHFSSAARPTPSLDPPPYPTPPHPAPPRPFVFILNCTMLLLCGKAGTFSSPHPHPTPPFRFLFLVARLFSSAARPTPTPATTPARPPFAPPPPPGRLRFYLRNISGWRYNASARPAAAGGRGGRV